MAFGDLLEFDAIDYQRRMSQCTDLQLKQKEVMKIRQRFSSSYTIGAGIGGAPFTLGFTLGLSTYGLRVHRVASAKRQIIEQELTNRNIALHVLRKRDFLIPLSTGPINSGVGFGINELALAGTNTVTMEAALPPDASASQIIHHPMDVLSGGLDGIQEQGQEMTWAVDQGSSLSEGALAANTTWVPSPSAANTVGFYYGMFVAQKAEAAVAGIVTTMTLNLIMESVAEKNPDIVKRWPNRCSRVIKVENFKGGACSFCSKLISSGFFWRRSYQFLLKKMPLITVQIAAHARKMTLTFARTAPPEIGDASNRSIF